MNLYRFGTRTLFFEVDRERRLLWAKKLVVLKEIKEKEVVELERETQKDIYTKVLPTESIDKYVTLWFLAFNIRPRVKQLSTINHSSFPQIPI